MLHFILVVCIARFASAGGVGNVTAEADSFAPPWVKVPDGRGTLTIVYSSAVTLILSAWAMLHLNIPTYRQSPARMFGTWFLWGSCSFLFPEFIIVVALTQWQQARKFRRGLNDEERRQREENPGLEKQEEHKANTPFSHLYAWYTVMGGFSVRLSSGTIHNIRNYSKRKRATTVERRVVEHLSTPDFLNLSIGASPRVLSKNGRVTLTGEGIIALAKQGHFLLMEDELISDKSKADYLTKAIVCIQVLWFVIQSFQRKAAGLPISILEFHVLVNITCGLVTYTIWFGKRRGVQTATPVAEEIISPRELASTMLSEATLKPKLLLLAYVQDATRWYNSNRTLWYAPLWACFEIDVKKRDRYSLTGTSTVSILEGDRRMLVYIPQTQASTRPPLERFRGRRVGAEREVQRQLMECLKELVKEGDVSSSQNTLTASSGPEQDEVAPARPGTHHSVPPGTESGIRIFSIIRLPPQSLRSSGTNFDKQIVGVDEFWRISLPSSSKILRPLSILVVLSAYGALHLIPGLSDFRFPTHTELLIWRVSCYLIISCLVGAPVSLWIGLWLWDQLLRPIFWRLDERRVEAIDMEMQPQSREETATDVSLTEAEFQQKRSESRPFAGVSMYWSINYGLAFLYAMLLGAARLYLIVESSISLRKERVEIFRTPDWNWLEYIPHI